MTPTYMQYFDRYQQDASSFAVNYDIQHLLTGLFEEAGEVAGILKRVHRGDPDYPSIEDLTKTPKYQTKLAHELGDILWYVATSAHALGFKLSEIADMNLTKLTDRKARNVIQGSGDDR